MCCAGGGGAEGPHPALRATFSRGEGFGGLTWGGESGILLSVNDA